MRSIFRGRATRHRGQEDHGRAVVDLGLQAVLRAHVLALDVDVDERREAVVFEQLAAQGGKAPEQVVEQLADGAAAGLDLTRAGGLGPQCRRDADAAQCPTPAQNST
jgi:hypothetical protein